MLCSENVVKISKGFVEKNLTWLQRTTFIQHASCCRRSKQEGFILNKLCSGLPQCESHTTLAETYIYLPSNDDKAEECRWRDTVNLPQTHNHWIKEFGKLVCSSALANCFRNGRGVTLVSAIQLIVKNIV